MLETKRSELTTRVIDLFSPIGKGQRALIVSPPKAGKTTVLKNIANAVTTNQGDVILMVLLVDERPEEVTDMDRSVDGEVIASTFDRPAEEHMRVAHLALEGQAPRRGGRDVVLLLDSITSLARASTWSCRPREDPLGGWTRRPYFLRGSSARPEHRGGREPHDNRHALIDTGSRMDEVIYEEFKGTGNMEVHLSRKLSEQRIFPAIDITRSGTRREEMLMDPDELQRVWTLRRRITNVDEAEVLNLILGKLKSTATNSEFLATIKLSQGKE